MQQPDFTPRFITLKNGIQVLVRIAVPEDAAALVQTISTYAADSEHLIITPEEFNPGPDRQEAWIRSFLDSSNSILLIAVHNNSIIGNIDLNGSPRKKLQHTAMVGMGIALEWRNSGLGTAMLHAALSWAQSNPVLEQLWLQVYHNNDAGIALYKKLGFTEQGRQPGFIRTGDGAYADNVLMGLALDKK